MRFLLLFLCLLIALPAMAEDTQLDDNYFSRIPVLHEGRIKPLDSFARVELRRFSGTDTLRGEPATAWLAQALFDPASALETELFLVEPEELRNLLELPERASRHYTLQELSVAMESRQEMIRGLLQKEDATLSKLERASLQLYTNMNDAAQLLRSFSLLLPLELPPELQQSLGLPEGEVNYLALTRVKETLLDRVKQTLKEKGDAIENYTSEERQYAMLALKLKVLENTGEANQLLRILPSTWGSGEWLSPWAMLLTGQASPQSGEAMEQWRLLAEAYRTKDADAWQNITARMLDQAGPALRWKLELEHAYYALHLLEFATLLYAAAFVLFLLPQRFGNGTLLLVAAIGCHAVLLGMRMLILGRPPVSTLYESTLFVSFIITSASFLWPGGNFRRERELAASALGAILLSVSTVYAADGDTMGVLVAVLNTNFWLATHVVCITAGYGWCLIAGTLAHFSLLTAARAKKPRGKKKPVPKPLPPHLLTLTIIALLFTSLGTILGGIWADQSWGRFWGWDPKENGALLIVLWLIWLLHGRVSKHFDTLGFTALLALINMVVAVSWFGVNLLNTGLHSYGFTHAAAAGLGAFCAAELAFVGITYTMARRRA